VTLAVLTNTAPSSWYDEDDVTIATALDVLADMAEARGT